MRRSLLSYVIGGLKCKVTSCCNCNLFTWVHDWWVQNEHEGELMSKSIIEKSKQRLTYLQWQDAHSNGSWFTVEDIESKIGEEAFICEEIGWIVYEDSKEIHLCSRRGLWTGKANTQEYGMYQRIPKTWILKREVFNLGNHKRN